MAKAYIMMNCDLGEEKEVIQSLQSIVGIKEAHGTLGLYDIVAQIECTTDEKIQEIVTQQIRKIGWKPKKTIEESIKETIEFFNHNKWLFK